MEIERQTIVTPSSNEGEITRATKSIEPIWKAIIGLVGFVGIVYAGSKTWIQIEANTKATEQLKEQVTRQYSTYKNEVDAIRKDYDEEMDVLEEELDRVKEKILYHEAYEQALKDTK